MSKKKGMILLTALFIFCLTTSSSLGQGEDLNFGKNKVQYQNFTWYYIQSKHYDIYYYDLGLHIAEFAAKTLEEATPRLEKIFNYQTRKRIPIILYNSPNNFQQTNVTSELIEENVGGFTEQFKTRVVLPFDGSYEHFRHVLTHELTHAFTFDMLYGDLVGNLLSAEYVQEPLWFAEGFAEYFSLGGVDIEGDMILRDGSINGYLIPLELAGGFLVYKEGQSAIQYIIKKYGEEKIAEILHQAKSKRSFERSLKSAIGLDENGLDEEWMKDLKKEYWPEIAARQEPKDFAKQLTNHQKDGSYLNEKPAFSPLGDRIAIFSDRKDYTEIYIISAIDGKVIDKVVRGERSGDLESLHSYVSGLSWSPDGRDITFVSKSQGKDVLCLVDVKKKKIYKRFKFNLESLLSPAWSPDGGNIVFTGVKEGRTDLYLTDIKTGTLQKLTDDDYDDREAAWSPDGKSIAFSSDRPLGAKYDSTYTYGHYNIFLLDPVSREIKPFTQGGEDNISPSFSPDGKRICFVSNRNGISNLYVQEMDSSTTYPLTNILTGCFTPSWSKDGEKMAFTCFYKGGWDIFLLKNIKPVTENGAPLAKTTLILEKEKPAEIPADTTQKKTEPQAEKKLDLSYYVFKSTEDKLDSLAKPIVPAEKETLAAKLTPIVYTPKKYKLKFTPDIISGNIGYSTFFGFQ
ncbi:MAG TPA: hypothetical protein VMT04_07235, partial [Terriglobales bacterium]|nr:hypothetical protein [Terriglobales bacterium]